MHLVMFDVDGTLVDTHDFDSTIFNRALKDVFNIDITDEWMNYGHVTDPGILVEAVDKKLGRVVTEKEYDLFRDHFCDLLSEAITDNPDTCKPIKGALELFQNLVGDDEVFVAVATGAWGPSACFKLGAAGYPLNRLVMATADDEAVRAEIMMTAYERAIERSGVDLFETITYVGDAPWDKVATAQLGWRFIGVGDRVKDAAVWLADFSDEKANQKALNLKAVSTK